MGKAFGNRKKESERPQNDFYQTPKCMTWELLKLNLFNKNQTILDPCCGQYAISNILKENGFNVDAKDIIYGDDFLRSNKKYDVIVMNPPFKIWDNFIIKAKECASIVCSIGKVNFFGSHKRNITNIWSHLRYIYIYDRQIAYDKPFREDGKVECGMLVSGWFIWDMNYNGYPELHILDMQQYILKKI